MANAEERLRELFSQWDLNGDGSISKEELSSVLNNIGQFDASEIDRVWDAVDEDKNGRVEYQEFVHWILTPGQIGSASTFLSEALKYHRADEESHRCHVKKNIPETVGPGIMAWNFGGCNGVPATLDYPVPLGMQYTVCMWVQINTFAEHEWSSLLGDPRRGFSISFGPDGDLRIFDPRDGETAHRLRKSAISPAKWTLLVMRGACTRAVKDHPEGYTDILAASASDGVVPIGRIERVCSGLVISQLGCHNTSVFAMSSFGVWARMLPDDDLSALFAMDAEPLKCVSAVQAELLRQGKRCPPARSQKQEDELTFQLANAAAGILEAGTLDLSSMLLVDSDLPRVLDAVVASFGAVVILRLCDNYITENGVVGHIAQFLAGLCSYFCFDLSGNFDISAAAEYILLASLPLDLGCSVDARGTHIQEKTIAKLLNETTVVADAARAAEDEERKSSEECAAFDEAQAELRARWAAECDDSTVALEVEWEEKPLDAACDQDDHGENGHSGHGHSDKNQDSCHGHGDGHPRHGDGHKGHGAHHDHGSHKDCGSHGNHTDHGHGHHERDHQKLPKNPKRHGNNKSVEVAEDVQKHQRETLAVAAWKAYDHAKGNFFTWRGKNQLPPACCGSAHLMAQLSYYSKGTQLRKAEEFGLDTCWSKLRRRDEWDEPPTTAESSTLPTTANLHEAVDVELVEILACKGNGYGRGAVTLTLRNNCATPLDVAVPAGTVFEHIVWNHCHNLLVRMLTHIRLGPNETRTQKLGAYSMNKTCIAAADDRLFLTSFLCDDKEVLKSQSEVWAHFEAALHPDGHAKRKVKQNAASKKGALDKHKSHVSSKHHKK